MIYNDNKLTPEKECNVINSKFSIKDEHQLKDLQEIHNKLKEQRDSLKSLNNDGKYNDIIKSIEDNMKSIENIMRKHYNVSSQSCSADMSSDVYGKIPRSKRTNTTVTRQQRSSPMQSNPFASFFKSVFGLKQPRIIIREDGYRNRFHNIVIQSECDPHRKCITRQVDILRMIMLFVALNPHCIFLPKICNIASNQLDLLLTLY